MKVAVIGAGIIGVLTAHFLQKRGAEVVVYDRLPQAASLTSKANGGQLSYSFCDALADPNLLAKMPGILAGFDPAFRIRPSLDPDFIRWGIRFLSQCTTSKRDLNTLALLKLAIRSAELMAPMNEQFGSEYNYARPGKLVLLSGAPSDELKRRIAIKRNLGLDVQLLSRDQLLRQEPAIERWNWQAQGALFSPGDEVGDPHRFAAALSKQLISRGAEFRYSCPIEKIQSDEGKSPAVCTHADTENFDAIVIATGYEANRLLKPLGIRVPVLGMAGYSLTLPATESSHQISITAPDQRIVFSRMGASVRIAGFADINVGTDVLQKRSEVLLQTAKQLAPDAADYAARNTQAWQGFRAMTPNSQPLLGATSQPGIFTNLGHGMLGWTLGAATSDKVASQVLKAA